MPRGSMRVQRRAPRGRSCGRRSSPYPTTNQLTEKTALQLAVQLVKRWRDIYFASTPDLAPISIVLTTLAGQHYAGEPSPMEALSRVVSSILGALPPFGRLYVLNPMNPLEDLSEKWDDDPRRYPAFVSRLPHARQGPRRHSRRARDRTGQRSSSKGSSGLSFPASSLSRPARSRKRDAMNGSASPGRGRGPWQRRGGPQCYRGRKQHVLWCVGFDRASSASPSRSYGCARPSRHS